MSQAKSILLASVVFLLSYIFLSHVLATLPGGPGVNNQENEITNASGTSEKIGLGSDISVTVERNTLLGYTRVRKGYSLYLGGLISLPDNVLGADFKDSGVHSIALYGSVVLIISSIIFEIREEEVDFVWK
ncbi:MAG: hypothetical protein MUP58_00900 [Candidatus Nanohaloarchaeota archaeon QJJ-9]|nr:hypothetical protein [Candidatus Nanohaloarchaeota archaeon QJJ-9]